MSTEESFIDAVKARDAREISLKRMELISETREAKDVIKDCKRRAWIQASKVWLEYMQLLSVLYFHSLALYKMIKSPCLNTCDQSQMWHVCSYILVNVPAFGKPEVKVMGWDYRHLVAIR